MATMQMNPPSLLSAITKSSMPGGVMSPARGVLVIDENEMVRTVLGLYFRQHGIPIWLASDGEEAIEILERDGAAIGVAFVDIHVTGLTDFCQFKERQKSLICYGMIEDDEASPGRDLKGNSVQSLVEKPYFLAVLERVVQQSLDRAAAILNFGSLGWFAEPYLDQAFGDVVRHCQYPKFGFQ